MSGGINKTNGYTIVEALIFLAVSSLIAISAILLVSGRQRATEFTDGLRDLESKIQDVMNDVATGYYPNDGTIQCTDNGTTVDIVADPTAPDQGTNEECIFIGKIIQFAPDGTDNRGLTIYTVAGRRSVSPGRLAQTIAEAAPQVIPASIIADTEQVGPIKIKHVTIGPGNPSSHGGVAILTNFRGYNPAGSLESGSIAADVYPIASGAGLDESETVFATNTNNELLLSLGSKNPALGVVICVESQGTDQHAEIIIGGDGASPTTTSVRYYNGRDCP